MGEAQRRRQHEQLVALAAYSVSAFDAPAEGQKREAPTEFRLFHAGVNHTSKGDFIFDETAANLVMGAYAAHHQSVPMMADYEHMSLASPPIKAPASATQWVPEIRRDAGGGPECWATKVQWTEEARGELEDGKYRLYSPAFVPDGEGRIAELINFALTNLPASYEIAPLVAASATTPTGDHEMDEELKALKAKNEELAARCARMEGLCLKRLGKSFDDWAKEESDEHEKLTASLKALTTLRSKVLELAGKTDDAEAIGVLALAVTQGKELVTLKQDLAAKALKAQETEFDGLLTKAVAEGKLPPAGPVSKEFFVGLKVDIGLEKALAALKKAVPESAQAIVQLSAPTQPHPASAISAERAAVATISAGRFGGMKALQDSLTAQAAK